MRAHCTFTSKRPGVSFLVFLKRMKLELCAKKTVEKNRPKAKLNMLSPEKEYFLKTKNSSGKKALDMKKQRRGLECEMG